MIIDDSYNEYNFRTHGVPLLIIVCANKKAVWVCPFDRACRKLGVEVIVSNSSQSKGRVE